MTDTLISLETAKLAREKGFVQHSGEGYYQLPGDEKAFVLWVFDDMEGEFLGYAPTQSLLAKWLREEHRFYVFIHPEPIGSDEWVFSYQLVWLPKEHWNAKRRALHFKEKYSFSEGPGSYSGGWNTYEEALEKGLFEALNLIK